MTSQHFQTGAGLDHPLQLMYLQRPNIPQGALGDSTEKNNCLSTGRNLEQNSKWVCCSIYILYKYICTPMQSVEKDTMLISKVFWLLFVDELTGHMWVGLLMLTTIGFDFAILKWTSFIHRHDIYPQRFIVSQLHCCISSFKSDCKTWQAHRRGNIGPDDLFTYIGTS